MIKILPFEIKKEFKPHFLVKVKTMVGDGDRYPIYEDTFETLNSDDQIIIKAINEKCLTDDEADRYDIDLSDSIFEARNDMKDSSWEAKWADLLYHYDGRSQDYEEVQHIEVTYFDADNNEHKVEIE